MRGAVGERVDGRERVGHDDDAHAGRDVRAKHEEVDDDGEELEHRDRELERADDVAGSERDRPRRAVHVAGDRGAVRAVLGGVGRHLTECRRRRLVVCRVGLELADCDEHADAGAGGERGDPDGHLHEHLLVRVHPARRAEVRGRDRRRVHVVHRARAKQERDEVLQEATQLRVVVALHMPRCLLMLLSMEICAQTQSPSLVKKTLHTLP